MLVKQAIYHSSHSTSLFVCLFLFFEMGGSHCVTQAGLELTILLAEPGGIQVLEL
jgi:hypothetical protein